MEHQEYENPFEEVRRKVKALKHRYRELNKRDAEHREISSMREAGELRDKEPKS